VGFNRKENARGREVVKQMAWRQQKFKVELLHGYEGSQVDWALESVECLVKDLHLVLNTVDF
jgi:hypothetical protein